MDPHIAKYIESVPGFRYHPTDEELMFALKAMILGTFDAYHGLIFQFNVCEHEPWELAGLIDEKTKFKSNSKEWYCFNLLTSKYSNSKRCSRTTGSGFWKSTGKKRDIISDDDELMGFRQTLVFHQGRVPNGIGTSWVMHEYHLNVNFLGDYNFSGSMPIVVCRIKYKKDKKVAKVGSSIHQDDHIINTNNTPITTESEFDDEPVSLATTPTALSSQLAENSWSPRMDLSEEFWGSLANIPMTPSNYYAGYWENPHEIGPEVDNFCSRHQY